jgi:hypothetical protein
VTPSLQNVVLCDDGIHCGSVCPNLLPYGSDTDLTAKCAITGGELIWHDFWVATECDTVCQVCGGSRYVINSVAMAHVDCRACNGTGFRIPTQNPSHQPHRTLCGVGLDGVVGRS